MKGSAPFVSPLTALILSVLLTPVLYLLSVPPVFKMAVSEECGMPLWAMAYAEPYKWLQRETSAEPWLTSYSRWWIRS